MSSQPQDVAAVSAVVEAQTASRQALTDQLMAQVQAIVAAFTGWYDDRVVARMAQQIAALVQPSQRTMASLSDAYLSRSATLIKGSAVRPVGPADVSALRMGVDPGQVYERLAHQFRYEVSQGTAAAEALRHVETRAQVMAETDLALANREQARRFMVVRDVAGWRRVIHPELSKGGTCGLCIAASQRIYAGKRLLPIHDRCHCEPLPIINGQDPAGHLNDVDLAALYKDAGSTAMKALKATRYQVDDHGELGPVLVPKKRNDDTKVPAHADAAGLSGMTPEQLAHQINLTEGLPDSTWRTAQLRRLRKERASRGK